MSGYKVDFTQAAWESPRPGARQQLVSNATRQMRMVEFTPQMSHPDWCSVGHSGLVLEGRLELQFVSETLVFEPGDGLFIPPGDAHKHIPRALTDVVRMILVDEPV